jgi:UDP-2,3-diacylglucosamine hydrolase
LCPDVIKFYLYSLLTSAESESKIHPMRTIFIADAHLAEPTDLNYRLMLRFLQELKGNTETLYILGDMFDFWLGFPDNPFRQYDQILDALLALKNSGCRLVYFEGNHDFHLGPVFRDQLGAEIHTGPHTSIIHGKRIFLCHGDQINLQDRGYRRLRTILRHPIVKTAVRYIPPSLAMAVKARLQHSSRSEYQVKAARWDYREIVRGFAASLRTEGCQGLVTGHFHLAYCEKSADGSFTTLSLGDWMKMFTYGEMVGGELLLKTYNPLD